MKFTAYKVITLLKALRDSSKKDMEKVKNEPLSWTHGFYKGHLEAYNFLLDTITQDLKEDIKELKEVINELQNTPKE